MISGKVRRTPLDIPQRQPGLEASIAAELPRRSPYALKELLGESDPKAPHSLQEREWLDSEPAGRELV
jgi:hypothetical protein